MMRWPPDRRLQLLVRRRNQLHPGFSSTFRLWISVSPIFSAEWVIGSFQYTSPALCSVTRCVPSASVTRVLSITPFATGWRRLTELSDRPLHPLWERLGRG